MSLPRARIVRAADAPTVQPLLAPGTGPSRRRVVAREAIEAQLAAERVVEEARARADALLAEARAQAGEAAGDAARRAREEADARMTAQWLALRRAEGERLDRDADRLIPLAVALAERLLGAALELDPARIVDIARGVLAEARGARRAVLDAHPLDAELLRRHLSQAGLQPQSFDVREDETLARGALRLHTDIGIIDAQLAPRLERLADALRDALG